MEPIQQIIMKVWMNGKTKQKLVTVPKKCNIEEGDYVEIRKVEMK